MAQTRFPYFRFSDPVKDPASLAPWVQHFIKRGVRCFVVRNQEGFALWRYGDEAKEMTHCRALPNGEEIDGEIVEEFGAETTITFDGRKKVG